MATAILYDAFSLGYPLDQAIRFHFQSAGKGLEDGDREKVLFRVYTVCHHLRTLCAATGIQEPSDLRHWVEILHAARILKAASPEGRDVQLKRRIEKIASVPAFSCCWTDELFAKGSRDWGADQFKAISAALLQTAPVFIRVNLLKISAGDLFTSLLRAGFSPEKTSEASILRIGKPSGLFKSEAFSSGYFEMQDINSFQVAKFCGTMPGQRVADACAGAGGKSLALAAIMRGKGRIVAFDVSEKKLEELRRRSRRAGAGIIETRATGKSLDRMQSSFDLVLVDAPCSGSGVLRRNPDARWRMNAEELKRLSALQTELLLRYAKMVKPGGSLVFASCSIFKCEGEEIREIFLLNRQDFVMEEEQRLFPGQNDGDGFYMVRLKRKADPGGADQNEKPDRANKIPV